MRLRTSLYSAVALIALSQSSAFAAPSGDAVIRWNANAGAAATKACIAPLDDPFHESRMYAMMHIAIHDALNARGRSGGSSTRRSGQGHRRVAS